MGDDKLIISVEDQLPPYIVDLDEFEDYEDNEDNETIELEYIELKDNESGEFLVIYDGKELLNLQLTKMIFLKQKMEQAIRKIKV